MPPVWGLPACEVPAGLLYSVCTVARRKLMGFWASAGSDWTVASVASSTPSWVASVRGFQHPYSSGHYMQASEKLSTPVESSWSFLLSPVVYILDIVEISVQLALQCTLTLPHHHDVDRHQLMLPMQCEMLQLHLATHQCLMRPPVISSMHGSCRLWLCRVAYRKAAHAHAPCAVYTSAECN